MNPQKFLEEFGAVANAPGGVKRLREMVLQLAVMGKLVEQDSEDEPASELLKRIEIEKSVLEEKNLIDRQNKLVPPVSDEIAYNLPSSWIWTRFGTVADHNAGKHFQAARNYWKVFKNRLGKEGYETVTKCNRLKMVAEDGKMRIIDVANPEIDEK